MANAPRLLVSWRQLIKYLHPAGQGDNLFPDKPAAAFIANQGDRHHDDNLLPNTLAVLARSQSHALRQAIAAMYEPTDETDAEPPSAEWEEWVQLRRQAAAQALQRNERTE